MCLLKSFSQEAFIEKYRETPLLFHGTNRPYFENSIKKNRIYEHKNGRPVELSPHLDNAVDYALRRSVGRSVEGILLIVETRVILSRLKKIFWMQPTVQYLEKDEFVVHRLQRRNRIEIFPYETEDIARVCREKFNVLFGYDDV